jgi:L-aminopeptidase/D-esterase-like protein
MHFMSDTWTVDNPIPGVRIGHWTDREAKTGCTVVVFPQGSTSSGEVRGGAPATREFALLDPTRTVAQVDAVILSGGSAFGLAAADGVVQQLEADGRGFPTSFGPVPIVVGMSLFDLAVGDPGVRPGPEEGRHAFLDAVGDASSGHPVAVPTGLIGAGTGATVNKWSGRAEPGGIGAAAVSTPGDDGQVHVLALMAVNAFGAVDRGSQPSDSLDPGPPRHALTHDGSGSVEGQNTTIGVVVTNARADKADCFRMAQSAHDGLARALLPAHTHVDGDAVVATATGEVTADLLHVRALVQAAVVEAVRCVAAG